MYEQAKLTTRETQIAELLAWGAAKKEVASQLHISTRTVENTARNIYQKVEIQKATELSVWWFCTRYHISLQLSPLRRSIVAAFFLGLLLSYEFQPQNSLFRTNARTARKTEARSARKPERRDPDQEFDFDDYQLATI